MSKEKVQVRVRRSKVPIWVRPDLVRHQVIITFWTEKIPPQTITMWEDEWSEEKEKQAIAEYIKRFEQAGGGSVEVSV